MKVLIACEYSGIVRSAFERAGHNAWSCDLLETEIDGKHLKMDVFAVIPMDEWDLMIAHPPCTHLAVSGARWFKYKRQEQLDALDFVRALMDAPIERIAIENPISVISSKIRKPDQIIQPWKLLEALEKIVEHQCYIAGNSTAALSGTHAIAKAAIANAAQPKEKK